MTYQVTVSNDNQKALVGLFEEHEAFKVVIDAEVLLSESIDRQELIDRVTARIRPIHRYLRKNRDYRRALEVGVISTLKALDMSDVFEPIEGEDSFNLPVLKYNLTAQRRAAAGLLSKAKIELIEYLFQHKDPETNWARGEDLKLGIFR